MANCFHLLPNHRPPSHLYDSHPSSSQPQTLCRPLSSSRGPVGAVGCSRTPQTCHAKGDIASDARLARNLFPTLLCFFFRARIFDNLSLIYGPPHSLSCHSLFSKPTQHALFSFAHACCLVRPDQDDSDSQCAQRHLDKAAN